MGVSAKIGIAGRCCETNLAVLPVMVKAAMPRAPISSAIRQAASAQMPRPVS